MTEEGPLELSRHTQLVSSTSGLRRSQLVVWDKHGIWSQRATAESCCTGMWKEARILEQRQILDSVSIKED